MQGFLHPNPKNDVLRKNLFDRLGLWGSEGNRLAFRVSVGDHNFTTN